MEMYLELIHHLLSQYVSALGLFELLLLLVELFLLLQDIEQLYRWIRCVCILFDFNSILHQILHVSIDFARVFPAIVF